MAQAQDMSVARAVFISGLLRSEPNAPEISRDDATLFARTLLRTCNVCTTSNIKVCGCSLKYSFCFEGILLTLHLNIALQVICREICPTLQFSDSSLGQIHDHTEQVVRPKESGYTHGYIKAWR